MKKKFFALFSAGILTLSFGQCLFPKIKTMAENTEQNQTVQERDLNAGYFELLDLDSYYSFNNWLMEEKQFDLEDEEELEYVNQNFNPLLFEAIDEGVIPDITNKKLRWMMEKHSYISGYAMNLLTKDGKTQVVNFYNQGSNDGEGHSLYHYLASATIDPDINENAWFYKGHFYCYDSKPSEYGTYYKNGSMIVIGDGPSFCPTARTRFEQHYEAAIYAWQSNYKIEAIEELGRAIHYLSDMGAPTHAINWGRVHPQQHNQYELWVNYVQASSDPTVEDSDPYDYWLPTGNEIFENEIILESYYDFMLYENYELICNSIAWAASDYQDCLNVPFKNEMENVMADPVILEKYDIYITHGSRYGCGAFKSFLL